jgi:signal transduction histidine kinase
MRMSTRTARTIAWGLWALALAQVIASAALLALNHAIFPAGGQAALAVGLLTAMVYASVGGLIGSRLPRNPIGWLLSVIGVVFAFSVLTEQYALRALVTAPGSLPGAHIVASAGNPAPIFAVASLLLVVLLFPDGHPPSPRWRPVLWVAVAVDAVGTIGFMLEKANVTGITNSLQDKGVSFHNTLGVFSTRGGMNVVLAVTGLLAMASALAAIVGLFVRRRRGSPELRQQLAWLGYVGVIAVVAFVVAIPLANSNGILGTVIWSVLFGDIVLGVPVACAIAILKYRLYELDIVIKKTVVFAVLAAFVTLVFVAVVVGIGTLVTGAGNSVVTFVATAIVAIAFQPLRTRARRFADRVVYGKRATPYEVLSEFSDRVATSYSTEEVLPRMAQILGEGLGAREAGVWLRVGSEVRLLATWPHSDGEVTGTEPISAVDAGALPGSDRTFPVRHQGELLGALTVAMPLAEPITPSKEKLASDLASQAGLVLRNVRLIEEVRASRQRLVAAQDEERRRIERNLHDGAQQQLVALAVKLGLARTVNEQDHERANQMLEVLQSDAQGALENLRDLARGIYPPLLADQGLAAALTAQARKAPLPVEVETDALGRYAQEAEAAVYFCCLEAMQNVAKYAGASAVRVKLRVEDGELAFEVSDDGRGFDPGSTPSGAGLQNMADRLAALGGSLEVRSQPGRGTTVAGRLPVRPTSTTNSVPGSRSRVLLPRQ